MDRKEVMAFFNERPRNCLLCTANKKGQTNIAVYGSPRMIDEDTIVLAARERRSFRYLQENPRAAIIITEPSEIRHDSKGIRLYLELIATETEGDLLNEFKEVLAQRAGKETADSIHAAMRFKITEVRSLVESTG